MKALILILVLQPWRIEVDGEEVCRAINPACPECQPGNLKIDLDNRVLGTKTEYIFKQGFENEQHEQSSGGDTRRRDGQ